VAAVALTQTEKTRGGFCFAAIILRDKGALSYGLAFIFFNSS
jgi:hypothetical protein